MTTLSSRCLAASLLCAVIAPALDAQVTPRALQVGADSVMRVPAHPSLEPTNALTVECWIKASGSLSNGRIVRKSGDFRPGYHLSFSFQGSRVGSDLYVGGSTYRVDDPLGNARLLGSWHHLAFTVQTGGQLNLYLDGERIASNPAPPLLEHSEAFVVGGLYISPTNIQEEFLGLVDEVRVWNVARTLEEIADNRFRYLSSGPGLVSAWHFDTDTNDSVGTNHGTLVGGARLVASDAPVRGLFETSADRGRWSGGEEIDLVGDFPGTALPSAVNFGGTPSPSFSYAAPNVLRVVVPPGETGSTVPITARFASVEFSSRNSYVYLPKLELPATARIGSTVALRLAVPPPGVSVVFAGLPPRVQVAIPGLDGFLGIEPPFVEIVATPIPFANFELPIAVPFDARLVGAEILVQGLFASSASPLVGTFVNLQSVRITS
ncbi:MAG: LamG domain-containing protein [Planctomycetes bacterium]|nr:LamG domain-containing protein [Planctomycetota bacterium]